MASVRFVPLYLSPPTMRRPCGVPRLSVGLSVWKSYTLAVTQPVLCWWSTYAVPVYHFLGQSKTPTAMPWRGSDLRRSAFGPGATAHTGRRSRAVTSALSLPRLLARSAYGRNYERLRSIKRKYGPEDVFHGNINIAP